MNNLLILILIVAILALVLCLRGGNDESFWGGYFPVPYNGQPIQLFGRYGFDAATDAPKWVIDPLTWPINPPFCPTCNSYRCKCVKK
jgi:hypothetical protein